jgi:hypothetical protein
MTVSDGYYAYPAHQRVFSLGPTAGCTGACGHGTTEDEENEERGDIGSALRDLGFESTADDVDGCTIEDARAAFFEVVGVDWNWEAIKDKWDAQAMHEAAALDPACDPEHTYDPYGNLKHRVYEEN